MNGGLRKLNDYLLAGAGVIGLMATGAPEAKAQQNLQQIQAQIDQMQATIKALQKQVEEAKAQATAAKSAAANSGGPSDIDLQVKWKGAPEFSSKDGKFKMKVRGRLEADYEKADQNTRITGFPDLSATEFRRARLGVEGILWYDYKYVFEIDFANDVVRVKDAYLQYQGFRLADNPVLFRIGNLRPSTHSKMKPAIASSITWSVQRLSMLGTSTGKSASERCTMPSTLDWQGAFSASALHPIKTSRSFPASQGMKI